MYVDDIKLAGKKQNIDPMWNVLNKEENQHHFLTMFIWVALKENVRLARILRIITKVCLNPRFLLLLWKNNQKPKLQGHLMPKRCLHGPVIWKVMQRIVWGDLLAQLDAQ